MSQRTKRPPDDVPNLDQRKQSIYMPLGLLERLRVVADAQGRSFSHVLQQAAMHWLETGAPAVHIPYMARRRGGGRQVSA